MRLVDEEAVESGDAEAAAVRTQQYLNRFMFKDPTDAELEKLVQRPVFLSRCVLVCVCVPVFVCACVRVWLCCSLCMCLCVACA